MIGALPRHEITRTRWQGRRERRDLGQSLAVALFARERLAHPRLYHRAPRLQFLPRSRVAHSSRVLAMAARPSRTLGFDEPSPERRPLETKSRKVRFGETPKPALETSA